MVAIDFRSCRHVVGQSRSRKSSTHGVCQLAKLDRHDSLFASTVVNDWGNMVVLSQKCQGIKYQRLHQNTSLRAVDPRDHLTIYGSSRFSGSQIRST